MNKLDIEKCLDSMVILIDTREKPNGERTEKRYSSFKCQYRRQTLDYADYTYSFTKPDGTEFFLPDERVKGDVVIERKMNLTELSGCFTHERKRFEAEFERAIENKAKIYLLVEDANWELLLNGSYRTKFNPKAYMASLTAYMARYNAVPVFCKHETSGKLIYEILRRELKERLEKGFYDFLII